jgi:hypothetical protein
MPEPIGFKLGMIGSSLIRRLPETIGGIGLESGTANVGTNGSVALRAYEYCVEFSEFRWLEPETIGGITLELEAGC